MNSTSKTTLQALGYGLAGAAAAAIASETAKRVSPSHSRLDLLGKRMHLHNPFGKGQHHRSLAGNLLSTPLLHNFIGRNFIGGRSSNRPWLRSALLGLGAGLGSLILPQQKRNRRSGRKGSNLMSIGRLLAGGLAAAATSRLLNQALRKRHTHTDDRFAHDRFAHDRP